MADKNVVQVTFELEKDPFDFIKKSLTDIQSLATEVTKDFEQISSSVKSVSVTVKETTAAMKNMGKATQGIRSDGMKDVASDANKIVPAVVEIKEEAERTADKVRKLRDNLREMSQTKMESIVSGLKTIASPTIDQLKSSMGELKAKISTIFDGLKKSPAKVFDKLNVGAQQLKKGFLKIKSMSLEDWGNALKSGVGKSLEFARDTSGKLIDTLQSGVRKAIEFKDKIGLKLFEGLKGMAKNAVGTLKKEIKNIKESLGKGLKTLSMNALKGIGKGVLGTIQGLGKGVTAAIKGLGKFTIGTAKMMGKAMISMAGMTQKAGAAIYQLSSMAAESNPEMGGGFTSQTQLMEQQIKSLSTSVGTVFLPIMTQGMTVLNGFASELNGVFSDGWQEGDLNSLADILTRALDAGAQAIEIGLPKIVDFIGDTVSTLGPVLLAILPSVFNTLLQGVQSLFQRLISIVQENKGTLVEGVLSIARNLVNTVTSLVPQLLLLGAQLIVSFVQGIAKELPTLIPMIVNALQQLLQSLSEIIPDLLDAGAQLLTGLADGLVEAMPMLAERIPVIIENIVDALLNNLDTILDAAMRIIDALVTGLLAALPKLMTAAVKLITGIVTGLSSHMSEIITSALEIIQVLIQGLIANLPLLIDSALQLIMSLVQGLLINLPLLIDCALLLVLGLAQGLLNNLDKIIEKGLELILAIIVGLIRNLPLLLGGALQLIIGLAVGLIKAIPQLILAGVKLIGALVKMILSTNWLAVGWDIVVAVGKGIWDGITGGNSSQEYLNSIDSSKYISEDKSQEITNDNVTAFQTEMNTSGFGNMASYANTVNADFGKKELENVLGESGQKTTKTNMIGNVMVTGLELATQQLGLVKNSTDGVSNSLTALGSTDVNMNDLVAGLRESGDTAQNTSVSLSGLQSVLQGASLSGASLTTPSQLGVTSVTEEEVAASNAAFLDMGQQNKIAYNQGFLSGESAWMTEIQNAQALTIPVSFFINPMSLITLIVTSKRIVDSCTSIFAQGFRQIQSSVIQSIRTIAVMISTISLFSAGQNLMRGLIQGMISMQIPLITTTNVLMQSILTTVGLVMDMHSPSKVMYEQGKYIGEGQELGMLSKQDDIKNASMTLSANSMFGFDPAGSTSFSSTLSSYRPDNSDAFSHSSATYEANTYSPQFNLTVNGDTNDRSTERKVKQWIRESLKESFESMGRRNPRLTEV